MDPSCNQATPFCKVKHSSIVLFQVSHYFPSLLATECFHYLFAGFQSCIVGKAITRSSNVSPKYSTDVHSEHGIKATMVSGNVGNNLDHWLWVFAAECSFGSTAPEAKHAKFPNKVHQLCLKASHRKKKLHLWPDDPDDQALLKLSPAQPSGWYSAELLCFLFGQCPFLADGSLHNDDKCEWAAVISAHHLCILQYQQ